MKLLLFLLAARAAEIPMPGPFQHCKTDAECTYAAELCGCCKYVALNKKFLKKYQALEKYCKEPTPPCSCAPSNTKVKCVKKFCEITTRNQD